MRKLYLTFVILFLTVTIGLAGTPVNPKSVTSTTNNYTKGRMSLSENEFDFGVSPQQAYISHSFWLKNVGRDTLEIIQIKPG